MIETCVVCLPLRPARCRCSLSTEECACISDGYPVDRCTVCSEKLFTIDLESGIPVDMREHEPGCPMGRATGNVAVACEHGFDCCPSCDPCTCEPESPETTERK